MLSNIESLAYAILNEGIHAIMFGEKYKEVSEKDNLEASDVSKKVYKKQSQQIKKAIKKQKKLNEKLGSINGAENNK